MGDQGELGTQPGDPVGNASTLPKEPNGITTRPCKRNETQQRTHSVKRKINRGRGKKKKKKKFSGVVQTQTFVPPEPNACAATRVGFSNGRFMPHATTRPNASGTGRCGELNRRTNWTPRVRGTRVRAANESVAQRQRINERRNGKRRPWWGVCQTTSEVWGRR